MSTLNFKSKEIAALCKKYHVSSLSLFGSRASGEAHPHSDVDLLVEFSQPVSLLHLVALERELSSVLGHRVDLVTEASLSPYLRGHILQEQRLVYAA